MNIKTLLLVGLGVGLTTVLTLKLLSLGKSEPTNLQSSTSASLLFNPTKVKLAPGEKTTVNVVLNTANHQVAAITLSLNFDPTKIKVVKINNGTLFPNTLSSAKISGNKAALSIATPPDVQGQTEGGTIATVELESLSNSSSTLTFDAETMAVALDQDGNILSSNGSLTVN